MYIIPMLFNAHPHLSYSVVVRYERVKCFLAFADRCALRAYRGLNQFVSIPTCIHTYIHVQGIAYIS